jgi:mono/diheme cytochrome c family protein
MTVRPPGRCRLASLTVGVVVVTFLARTNAAQHALPANVTPEMVQRGDALFHGPGRCFRCHGEDAKGTPKGPGLRAPKHWIQIRGEYEEIVQLVTKGVPEPKEHAAPMPPRGNAKLSDADVRDVAAYVWSISH